MKMTYKNLTFGVKIVTKKQNNFSLINFIHLNKLIQTSPLLKVYIFSYIFENDIFFVFYCLNL